MRGLYLLIAIGLSTPLMVHALGPTPLRPVAREAMRVTEGEIAQRPSGELSIEAPKVRAVVGDRSEDSVELSFRYEGPSATTSALASGEQRRQLGLKLRAADGCNLVYVMWRLEPKSALAISVKRNPGQARSAECGNHGYRTLPLVSVPRLEPNTAHTLRAQLEGDRLTVFVDGLEAWQGSLGEEVRSMSGPVGLRTDNVRLSFRLSAGAP